VRKNHTEGKRWVPCANEKDKNGQGLNWGGKEKTRERKDAPREKREGGGPIKKESEGGVSGK